MPNVLVAGKYLLESAQVAQGLGLPAVVEEDANRGDQERPGVLVVLLRLPEQQLGKTSALVVNRLLLVTVVLPGP